MSEIMNGRVIKPSQYEGVSIVYNDPEVVAEVVVRMSEAISLAAKEARENGQSLPKDWHDRIIG